MTTSPTSNWEGHLAALNLAYNTAVHSAYKLQPASVICGRQFSMPHIDPTDLPVSMLSWALQQQQMLRKTWDTLQQRLQAAGNAKSARRVKRALQTSSSNAMPGSGKTTQRNLDNGRDKRTSNCKDVQTSLTQGPKEGSRKEQQQMRMALHVGSHEIYQEKEVPNATEAAGTGRSWT